jgi:hypothetical protein
MTVIGYARVSTTDQDLSSQEGALRGARSSAPKSGRVPRRKGARSCAPFSMSCVRATCSW